MYVQIMLTYKRKTLRFESHSGSQDLPRERDRETQILPGFANSQNYGNMVQDKSLTFRIGFAKLIYLFGISRRPL